MPGVFVDVLAMSVDLILAGGSPEAIVANAFDVAEAGHASGVDQIQTLVRRFEQRVKHAEEAFAAATKLVSEIENRTAKNLDQTSEDQVSELTRAEESMESVRRSLIAKAYQNEWLASQQAPHLTPWLEQMRVLVDKECRLYVEAARDVRWAAMAYLASQEPPSDEPILASPEDVDAYLHALRA